MRVPIYFKVAALPANTGKTLAAVMEKRMRLLFSDLNASCTEYLLL